MLVQARFRSIFIAALRVVFTPHGPRFVLPPALGTMLLRCWPKFGAFCLAGYVAMAAAVGWADPALMRKFNGPDKSWQLLTGPTPSQVLSQAILPGGARDAAGYERVVVAAAVGQTAFLACPIERVAVLDELQARVWVNASRPDIQLAVRVVLPRSVDAQKRVATAIVRGSAYGRPGNWQELRVGEVPRLLADQVRVMRATPGASIDPKEAYVDAVVLLVPGNPSGTEIGTDDLAVDGVVIPATSATPTASAARQLPGTSAKQVSRSATAPEKPQNGAPERMASALTGAPVRLQGTVLNVDGRAFLPRVIQSNGEPLAFLAACGFNVIQLPEAPTPAQSTEATRLGVWFLCAPARPDTIARDGVGRPGDRVLSWQLQDDVLEVDSSYAMRWSEAVRERDSVFGRPITVMPKANWGAVNKAADILIARNPRSGPVRPLEFEAWLDACPQKAPPGTPLWIGISTQTDETVRQQVGSLTHVTMPALNVDPQQLESHVQLACAHNARGFVFQSASALNGVDDATQQRVAALQLINRRLQLIEPWLAGGKVISQVSSLDGVEIGMLLYVDRARLLMPLPNERAVTKPNNGLGQLAKKETVFVVPGVPETSQVFYFSPTTMRTLPSERIAGGTKFSIPAAGGGYIVMTEDARVIQSLQQRIARDGGRTVQLERELAARRARAFAYGSQRMVQVGLNADIAAREAAAVNQQLVQVDSHLAAGRAEQAHDAISILMKMIEAAIAEQRATIAEGATLESNPLAAFSDTLPELVALDRSLASLRAGDNLLMGGDFEDLRQLTEHGWQHMEGGTANAQTSAQLSAIQPQQGTYCLELNAAAEAHHGRQQAAGNLVSIMSPPMAVEPDKLIEITGWVRVDSPFAGGEGLEITDSLGGQGLSLVVNQTSGWQPFRLIRAAKDPSQVRLTFALTGIGSAKVDAVMVRMLQQPIARRLPPATPSTATATNVGAGGAAGPGLLAPPAR